MTPFASNSTVVSAIRQHVVWFTALAAALGTASIYRLQPAIADVAGSLHASLATAAIAMIITVAIRRNTPSLS